MTTRELLDVMIAMAAGDAEPEDASGVLRFLETGSADDEPGECPGCELCQADTP